MYMYMHVALLIAGSANPVDHIPTIAIHRLWRLRAVQYWMNPIAR